MPVTLICEPWFFAVTLPLGVPAGDLDDQVEEIVAILQAATAPRR